MISFRLTRSFTFSGNGPNVSSIFKAFACLVYTLLRGWPEISDMICISVMSSKPLLCFSETFRT